MASQAIWLQVWPRKWSNTLFLMPNLLEKGFTTNMAASLTIKAQKSRKAGNEKERVGLLVNPLFFISSLTYADREP